MKKIIIFSIIILIISGMGLFVIKNSEYIFKKYKWYRVEKEAEKRYKELIEKSKSNQILTSDELNQIAVYYNLASKYDEGIKFLEQLKDSEDYKIEKYLIYFKLSGFYTAKAKEAPKIQERQMMIRKADEYLNIGFSNTPEKALSYYLRAKGYEMMGCMKKAKADLQEAINIAKSKDTIFFEEGIYLDRKRFIQFVGADLDRVKILKDDCILEK